MDDLRRRLKRLGVTKGRDFKPKPRSQPAVPLAELVDGTVETTELGECYLVRHTYPPATEHGSRTLGEWQALSAEVLGSIGDDDELSSIDPADYVFIDTETTGLGGGAIAFLVGVGFFNMEGLYEIRQYFLRDPAEEAAMLTLLADVVTPDAALVTFNGRAFDVPLLAGRYIMNRQRTLIESLPNLDLLHPARRLWRRRLSSCALSALETSVLGLQRTEDDVPGSLIPYLYQQYLQTGNARAMMRVLYHNEIDLLSMVSLGVILSEAYSQPDAPETPIDDRLSLARWYQQAGNQQDAETAYRQAADEAPDTDARYDALYGLAYLLKRADRREEALPHWRDLADLNVDTVGHVELAKHFEWQQGDFDRALAWTEAAIALVESWRPGLRRTDSLRELTHRKERLLRKLNQRGPEEG